MIIETVRKHEFKVRKSLGLSAIKQGSPGGTLRNIIVRVYRQTPHTHTFRDEIECYENKQNS